MEQNTQALASGRVRPGWPAVTTMLQFFITITLPAFLVLTGVRLVATKPFLQLEYHRPGFPEDRYGFTREDRLVYAPYAVNYMHNDADINYLGDLELDGMPLFTERELRHMEDVKVVARAAFRVHLVLSLALALDMVILTWRHETRRALWRGLANGGLFTILLILTLVVLVITNWDFFFTGFHNLFFEGDTWLFRTSDTLIRLFPEQFWFDAALTIGLLTIAGALAAMFIGIRNPVSQPADLPGGVGTQPSE